MSAMTKAERAELRPIVRQQFRVLRAEVDQRELELRADVEQQIVDKYAEENTAWDEINTEIDTILADANKAVHDVLYKHGLRVKDGSERQLLSLARDLREKPSTTEQQTLRRLGYTRLSAQVQSAKVDLDRREADLLRDLAVGALESDAAREFLSSIPTVGELVPATRLAELEASLGDDR